MRAISGLPEIGTWKLPSRQGRLERSSSTVIAGTGNPSLCEKLLRLRLANWMDPRAKIPRG